MAFSKGYRFVFIGYAIVGLLLFLSSCRYVWKYKQFVAFVLLPFACFSFIFNNIVLAAVGSSDRDNRVVQAMFVSHALFIPIILLTCYEIAYLVHKKRSVNFCGITFDERHRSPACCSTILRFSVWLIALLIFVMNVFACYQWENSSDDDELSIKVSYYDLPNFHTLHVALSIIPSLFIVFFSLYIGIQLWKYGTFYAFTVHATYFNPWIWMVVGSIGLAIGQSMPYSILDLSSSAGEILMILCILKIFEVVHIDLIQGNQMQDFINPVVVPSDNLPNRISYHIEIFNKGVYTSMTTPTEKNRESESEDSFVMEL